MFFDLVKKAESAELDIKEEYNLFENEDFFEPVKNASWGKRDSRRII